MKKNFSSSKKEMILPIGLFLSFYSFILLSSSAYSMKEEVINEEDKKNKYFITAEKRDTTKIKKLVSSFRSLVNKHIYGENSCKECMSSLNGIHLLEELKKDRKTRNTIEQYNKNKSLDIFSLKDALNEGGLLQMALHHKNEECINLVSRLNWLIFENGSKLETQLDTECDNIIYHRDKDWFYTGLGIDGGGIRGIMPSIWLQEIEKKIWEIQSPKTRLWELFDYIGGTSIGGILALGCVASKDGTNPFINTETLVNLFQEKKESIFTKSTITWSYEEKNNKKRKSVFIDTQIVLEDVIKHVPVFNKIGIPGYTKYNAKNLEKELEQYFGDTSLKKSLTNVLVTAATEKHRPIILSSRAAQYNENKNCFMKDAARSTSAAQTYFSGYELRNTKGQKNEAWGEYVIDGGLWCNNPGRLVYDEIRKLYDTSSKDVLFISLGTGYSPISPMPQYASPYQAIEPTIFGMMQSTSEGVHQSLVREFRGTDQYYRVNPHFYKEIELDSIDNLTVEELMKEAKYAGEDGLMEEIARRLLENKDRRPRESWNRFSKTRNNKFY